MSLKGGLSGTEIRNAISNNNLSRYVEDGTISTEKYNELLKIYGVAHRANEERKKKPKKVKDMVCSVLSVIVLFSSMLCSLPLIMKDYEKGGAVCYFFLWICAFGYVTSSYDKQIARLERENENLKAKLETYKPTHNNTNYIEKGSSLCQASREKRE